MIIRHGSKKPSNCSSFSPSVNNLELIVAHQTKRLHPCNGRCRCKAWPQLSVSATVSKECRIGWRNCSAIWKPLCGLLVCVRTCMWLAMPGQADSALYRSSHDRVFSHRARKQDTAYEWRPRCVWLAEGATCCHFAFSVQPNTHTQCIAVLGWLLWKRDWSQIQVTQLKI